MWYFTWFLGVAMAVLLAIVNAVYGENHEKTDANGEVLDQAE